MTTIFDAAQSVHGLGTPRLKAVIKSMLTHLQKNGLKSTTPRLGNRLEDLWEADPTACHRLEREYFDARKHEDLTAVLVDYIRSRTGDFPG